MKLISPSVLASIKREAFSKGVVTFCSLSFENLSTTRLTLRRRGKNLHICNENTKECEVVKGYFEDGR